MKEIVRQEYTAKFRAKSSKEVRRDALYVRILVSFDKTNTMIETNPIANRIADLRERVAALRGYL